MKRILIMVALASICAFSSAMVSVAGAVTLVKPSERVATRLQVREYPTTADTVAIVGKLLKNETAELLASVPRWYRIRLDNNVEGYVSKSWSDTLSRDPAREELRVRLGAWNIKKLGHGSSKDYSAVVQVIEAHFDVVVIVEVMQKQQAHAGYDIVQGQLGSDWGHVVTQSPRPNTTSGSAEFYAVLFRRDVARVHADWTGLRFSADNDGSSAGTGADNFSREPAYTYIELIHPDGTVACDFLVGAYHATWSGGTKSIIKAEVGNVDSVMAEMAGSVSGENDIWLLGDFNLVKDDLEPLTEASDIVIGTGSTLNSTGQRTTNLYDHMLIRDLGSSTELVGDGRVLDVREVVDSNDVFYGSVSDHLPIVVHVHATVDDD